ncbi:MAG TPA: leucine-rich repeat domain-containing protein [Candidatus Angelobacter sp.]
MATSSHSQAQGPQGARFSVFEMDFASGELWQNGRRVRLQEQPFRILAALVLRPNEVITLEELYSVLSSQVDAKHALYNAVLKIREALGDSADAPRFLESVPRKGYRFIGQVDFITMPADNLKKNAATEPEAPAALPPKTTVLKKYWYYLGVIAVLVAAGIVFLVHEREPNPAQLEALGWKVAGHGQGMTLTFQGVPDRDSWEILRRMRAPFTIKLVTAWLDKDISGWRSLKNLAGLDLSYTKVTDLTPLQGLSNLISLDLSHNSFLTDVGPLSRLQNLNTLDLSHTDLTDLTPLKDLKHLYLLDLTDTEVGDVRPLRTVEYLTALYLDATKVSDISPLRDLKNLTALSLRRDKIADWTQLKDLPNLNELNLDATNFSDLNLLKDLKNLRSLSLRFTNVPQASIEELHHARPNLYLVW